MRRSDWTTIFADYIESRRNLPFSWGTNDCCFFAGEWFYACTGVDPLVEYRQKYSTALQAARFLTEAGGIPAIADAVAPRLLNPLYANIGDVLLVQNAGRDLLAIANGSVAMAPGDHGIIMLPVDKVTVGWKV